MQAIPSHDPRAGSNTLKKARRALNRCPIGHSSRADLLDDVANACQTEFERLGDLKLLGEAVERRRQALDLLSPGHPDRALTLSNLAYSVQTRSEQLGDLDSLAEVIELHRQALDLRPPGNPDRSSSLDNLANALDAHFVQLGDLNSLAEAIELYRQALDSRPSWHPDRPLSLNNLATTLHTQFEQLGDLDSLTEATYLLRQALSLRPPGHSDRATSLNNLASVVHTRFEQFGDLDSLTEVIELHRQALALRPSGHPDRPFSLNNLATAVHTRFEQAGDLDSLTEAIELLRQALILRPPGHPERSTSLSNLASAVNTQFDQIGNPDSLAEAIALHRHALDLRPPGHSKRSISLDNLANALHARFEQSGDLGALEETIDLHRQALSLRSPGHPDRSFSLSNLAAAVQTQFDSDGDLDLLTQAIGLHRQALNERPPGHPEHARSLSNLGTAVQKLGDYDSRVEALALHRRALKLRPPGHPQRPLSLSLLAKSVRSRYESPDSNRNGVVARWMSFLGVGSHLEEELDLYKEGLGLCGDGNPMRMSFLFDIGECLLRTETHLYNFQDGIRHIMEGLRDRSSPASQSLRRGSRSLGIIEAAYQFSMEHTDAVVFDRHDDDDLVLQVYILVIRLLPRAASFELDASGRLHALSGAETISRDAATRAIAAGRNKEAVEMLEEGRGVFWSQALRLRAKNLDLLPANDAQELRRLFRMLELGSMHDESMGKLQREQSLEERRRVSNAAEALITEIRSRPGLSHFLLPPAFSSLVQSLPETGFVVILVTSKLSHYALVLDRTNARTTSLELFPPEGGFLSEVVQASLPRDSNASTQDKTASRAFGISKKANRRQHEPLDLVLAQLWISIVKPVIDVITVEVGSSGNYFGYTLTFDFRRPQGSSVRVYGGVRQESSASFPSTLLASFETAFWSPLVITSCLHISLRSQRSPKPVRVGARCLAHSWLAFWQPAQTLRVKRRCTTSSARSKLRRPASNRHQRRFCICRRLTPPCRCCRKCSRHSADTSSILRAMASKRSTH
jgi:tetratricopeptide (TPR) repeat protein